MALSEHATNGSLVGSNAFLGTVECPFCRSNNYYNFQIIIDQCRPIFVQIDYIFNHVVFRAMECYYGSLDLRLGRLLC